MIKWRPATEADIGMPCRFCNVEPGRPIKQHVVYGILHELGQHPLIEGYQFVCEHGDDDTEPFIFAEVAEHERTPIDDPQLDIRIAVLDALNFWLICEHGDRDLEPFIFAEVAERERTPIADPILDVRVAVADALNFWLKDSRHIHGSINNSVVDKLPAYFRQKLYTEGK